MDQNITMDRRFSLNLTQMPNPIAESTCLNLNGSTKFGVTGGKNMSNKQFRWGGSPISPKNRGNASIYLNNTSTLHKSRSMASSPQRARMNLSKIDPRIYADVQSRGLVSRIVKYHEHGSRLNRSKSASNLCSISDPSSIAQLQKTDLPYRATQQNVSMTRIAPPKKSVFYGNTLSSLLRSNSVISVQKSDEEISCENRPILHPPPTENDLAPTRSVLDVLKEISRKRINSEDTDNMLDANKKYCNRDCTDLPYEQTTTTADLRNLSMQVGVVKGPMSVPVQSYKRQREQIVPPQQHTTQYTVNNGTSGASQSTMQIQRSPEQIAKKRLCSYNNDITSSLSSSLIHANKRKFYEQHISTNLRSPHAKAEEFETQKSKMQRQQSDLRFQQLTKSLSCNTPITPIPTTPLTQSDTPTRIPNEKDISEGSVVINEAVKRTVSEPPTISRGMNRKPPKNKITLFNRDYNDASSFQVVNGNDEPIVENNKDVDDGECADIQFVKPKKSSTIINKKNPLIERTQKSKLAMMLSGLRGEIYQGDDEVKKISFNMTSSNAQQTNKTITNEDSVDKAVAGAKSTTTTTNVTNFVLKTAEKSIDAAKEARKSNTPVSEISTVKEAAAPATTAVASSISATSSLPTTTITSSTLGGFKLTTSKPDNNITSTTPTPPAPAAVTKTTSPLVGLKLTPPKPSLSFASNPSTVAPTFNFGTTNAKSTDSTKTVEGTIATGVGAVPQLQGFSFGTTTNSATSNAAAVAATLTTTPTVAAATTTGVLRPAGDIGGFKFAPTQNTKVSTVAPSVTPTVTAAVAPTFRNFANTIASTTTSTSTEVAKPVFAFGATAAITTTATAIKPTISFGGSATLASKADTANPFGNAASGTFNFGVATCSSAAVTTLALSTAPVAQSPNLFGNSVANTALTMPTSSLTSTPFAFGSTPTTTQTTTTTTATFSFGSAATTTTNTAANVTATATNNLFSFGSQKSTTDANTTVMPFAFGTAAQKVTSTATTTSTNSKKPIFSFGGVADSTANTISGASKTNSSSGNLFTFAGTPAASDNKFLPNNPAGANYLQSGAATSAQPPAFTFGGVAAQGTTSTSAFGATNTQSATPAAPFAFGAGNANTSGAALRGGPVASSSAGGFSFGAAAIGGGTTNNTISTNIFGSASSTLPATPTPQTGIAKPAFSFGGATATPNDSANSIFGGAVTNTGSNASSGNTFGALATANSGQNKQTFSFGGNSAASNNPPPNPFAAAANKPATGGFSFAANATINKSTTGPPALAPNSTTPFAFGGTASGGATTSATTTPFAFGNANGGATANKTFAFGSGAKSPAAPAANASTMFGSTSHAAAGAQQTSATPFSFSTGPSTSSGAAPSAAQNLFASPVAPGAVSGGGGDRKIRRATRRLQKT